jgi:hypothetical protein
LQNEGMFLTFLAHVPMDAREWDDILQTLQTPNNKRPVRPWTCVGDIEMIAVFLSGELCSRFVFNEGAEDRLLAFEFASLIVARDPVGY